MKKIKLAAVSCLLLGALISSCNKGSGNQPSTNSTDEAADLVTASLSLNTSGSVSNTDDVTVSAQVKLTADSLCGTTWTDSVNRSVGFGQSVNFTYKATHTYALDCGTGANGLTSDIVTANSVFSGSFSDPILKSSYTGTSTFTVAGLGLGSPIFTVNGEYKRMGSFVSKTDTTFSGSHNVDVVIKNLILVKPLRTIRSGTATFTITGNMPKRGSIDFTGTVVFQGGYNATVTVNGTVYIVNLATGAKRKA